MGAALALQGLGRHAIALSRYPQVEVIGMLPAELQQITIYSGGVTAGAKQPDAAKALLSALTAPSAQPIYKSKGLAF